MYIQYHWIMSFGHFKHKKCSIIKPIRTQSGSEQNQAIAMIIMFVFVCEYETEIEDRYSYFLAFLYIFFCLLDNVIAANNSLYY